MPPQPLSKVKRDAKVAFSRNTAISRREHAALITQVISIWSDADAILAQAVTHFLKSDYEIVSVMLQTLSSSEARRDVILAAAKESLSHEDYLLFRAVLAVTRASRKRRNDFAHHLWGTADDLPDAILLADPKIVLQPLTDMWIRIRDAEGLHTPYIEDPDPSKIFVYRKQDLSEEVKKALEAHFYILNLTFLAQDSRIGGGSTRDELLSQPQIQQQYQKLVQAEPPPPQPEQQQENDLG